MKILGRCNNPKHHDINYNGTTGRKAFNPSLDMIEYFIKEEIDLTKTCGCPHCNFRRHMFRAIQGIINEYKVLKKEGVKK